MSLHSRLKIAFTFFLSCTVPTLAATTWEQDALRLSGESDAIRTQALRHLKKSRSLQAELLSVLNQPPTGTAFRDRSLALDVVNALEMRSLVPELWKLSLSLDPGGQVLLTALSLSPEPLAAWIPERLWGMVMDQARPLANRWVALEALSRLSSWTWRPRHMNFLARTHPQLAWVALNALRIQILGRGRLLDLELVQPFLKHSDLELRLRAQQIVDERRGRQPVFQNRRAPLPQLTQAIFFGYKDSRPSRYVADRIEAAYLLDQKTHQGWKRINNGSALPIVLEKGSQRVGLWFASVGPDDAINRKDPYQNFWSERTSHDFQEALEKVPAIAYVGHSRDGGGPDFAPPLLDPSGHVHYSAYPRAAAFQSLNQKKGAQIQFLGLYSCASRQHFAQLLQRALPQSKIDLSDDLIYWTDALERMDQAF